MKMFHFILGSLVLLSACTTTSKSASSEAPQLLTATLQKIGLRAAFSPEYRVSKNSEDLNDSIQMRSIEAVTPDGRTFRAQKLEGSNPEQGERFIEGKITQLGLIYAPHREPYFASVTQNAVCPDSFQPSQIKSAKVAEATTEVFALYANDRMTYGACTPEQAVYRVFLALLNCKSSGSVFVVETFIPVGVLKDFDTQGINSVQCL